MELIYNHINNYLDSFLKEQDFQFKRVIDNLHNDLKLEFLPVLGYLNELLKVYPNINEKINVFHLHFENNFNNNVKELIAEFLIVKLYYDCVETDLGIQTERNLVLAETIENLTKKVNSSLYFPGGITKQTENKIRLERKSKKSLLAFYNKLDSNLNVIPKNLFNLQVVLNNNLKILFESRPFAIKLGDYNLSYNVINTNKSLYEIDEFQSEIIDDLQSIILFDCGRKSEMTTYSFEEIQKWNSEFGTNFRKYLVLTFGKEIKSLNNSRSKIEATKEKFKIPNKSSYTIFASEIDFLLNRKKGGKISNKFIGPKNCIFWDNFLMQTNVLELYELRSIKLMNIYSMCLNEEIKNYILEDLFSNSESSELIKTKHAILELREEDIIQLKDALAAVLSLIIDLDFKTLIIKHTNYKTVLVLDESIINNQSIKSKINAVLFPLGDTNRLISWSNIDTFKSNPLLILTYRDQGKFPNYFYPNIVEPVGENYFSVSSINLRFFFEHQYNWAKYNLYIDFQSLGEHVVRVDFFQWELLKSSIKKMIPESKLTIDWNLEFEYSYSENRDSYKLKLKNHKARSFNGSDLFIFKDSLSNNYKVIKICDLFTFEITGEKYFIQNLDDIQEDINIYEKIVDIKQQEDELKVIRNQFKIENDETGRLWKILLKRKVEKKGEENFYNELKAYLEMKKLKIVSSFHFKNSWINPLSESIAPLNKKVFVAVCEYLQIPKIYFAIIQRIKNTSKQSSRQSTRQMNQLLKDLFNDGCFDSELNTRDIITNRLSFYKKNHPLDELGIDENYLLDSLVTLTELIQPELKLLEVESIEKINNE